MAAPNGHLVQPRTCATRTRRGQLDGIACAPAATPSSVRPSQRPRHSTPTMSSSPSTLSRSPLPKTLWTGPWQRRQTTRTTRPCQTHRLSLRSSTCRQLRHLHLRCRTWSAASLCASCTALNHADSQQKCTTIIISHCVLCCLTCPLSRVWCVSVVSRVRCPVCGVSLLSHVSVVFVLCVLPRLPDSDKKVSVFFFLTMASKKVLTQGDFCAVL